MCLQCLHIPVGGSQGMSHWGLASRTEKTSSPPLLTSPLISPFQLMPQSHSIRALESGPRGWQPPAQWELCLAISEDCGAPVRRISICKWDGLLLIYFIHLRNSTLYLWMCLVSYLPREHPWPTEGSLLAET